MTATQLCPECHGDGTVLDRRVVCDLAVWLRLRAEVWRAEPAPIQSSGWVRITRGSWRCQSLLSRAPGFSM